MGKQPIIIYPSKPVPFSRCIRCKTAIDAATGIGKRQPSPGDVSICAYCGQVMLFSDDLTLVSAPQEVRDQIKTEMPDTWNIIETASRFYISRRAAREN